LQKLKFDQPDPYGFSFAGKSPEQQFNIRSTLFLPHNLEWNMAAYYVDGLRALDANSQPTAAYTRLDTRLAWQAMDGVEVSLVGQNLLDDMHKEFNGFLYQNSVQIPRSFYGNVTVKF
jgi:iron complex outermembrane receptor protein